MSVGEVVDKEGGVFRGRREGTAKRMMLDKHNWTTICILVLNRGKGKTTAPCASENIHLLY